MLRAGTGALSTPPSRAASLRSRKPSGIDLSNRYLGERGARDLGATFRLVHEQIRFGTLTDRLQHAGRDITSLAGRLSEEAALFDRLVQIMTPAPESAEETK